MRFTVHWVCRFGWAINLVIFERFCIGWWGELRILWQMVSWRIKFCLFCCFRLNLFNFISLVNFAIFQSIELKIHINALNSPQKPQQFLSNFNTLPLSIQSTSQIELKTHQNHKSVKNNFLFPFHHFMHIYTSFLLSFLIWLLFFYCYDAANFLFPLNLMPEHLNMCEYVNKWKRKIVNWKERLNEKCKYRKK